MIVVPRLMTAYWQKHLTRATDCYFKLEHETLWPKATQYKLVLIFLCLPLVLHRPMVKKRAQLLEQLEWLLLGPRVSQAHSSGFQSSLHELLLASRSLLTL